MKRVGLMALVLAAGTATAAPPAFVDLHAPFPTAESTHVTAMIPNGLMAVGWVDFGPGNSNFGATWDLASGTGVLLPNPPGLIAGTTDVYGVSDDGSVITGSGWNGTIRVTVRWVNGTPSIVSGSAWTDNFGLSGDGAVAIGRTLAPGDQWLASRWTSSNGVEGLQPLFSGTTPGTALGVSFDGSVIAGNSPGVIGDPLFPGFIVQLATWWDSAGFPHALHLGGELESGVRTVSSDGRFAAGQGHFGTGMNAAVRWDLTTGVHTFLTRARSPDIAISLGNPTAYATTLDGSVVALNAHEFGYGAGASLWTESSGLVNITRVLEDDFGLDLSHWSLSMVTDMTKLDDGSIVVVGEGNYRSNPGDPLTQVRRSFMASIPSLPASGLIPCDPIWEAPANLSSPGLTNHVGNSDPVQVNDLVVYGGKLYALGNFTHAGGSFIGAGIASWNGDAWAPAGVGLGGTNASGLASLVYDDGTGEALYVGGSFTIVGGQFINGIARWNGIQWSSLGAVGLSGGGVRALAMFDDGNGPALYAAGWFTQAGGVSVNGLARWNGSSWSSIGSPSTNNVITSMAVFDDGTGPALYVSGGFSNMGGAPTRRLARWDGSTWSEVGGGLDSGTAHMVTFDDGSGPALYMAGGFSAGGQSMSGLIRWTGQRFEHVASLQANIVQDMAVVDDGQGPALVIASSGGTYSDGQSDDQHSVGSGLLRWDGHRLKRIGLPNEGYAGFFFAGPIAEFDDGSGPAIYAAGDFDLIYSDAAGGAVPAGNIARIVPCHESAPACPADWNGDRELNFFDVQAFLADFSAQAPRADLAPDGQFNFFDVQVFLSAFSAGCP